MRVHLNHRILNAGGIDNVVDIYSQYVSEL